MAWEVTEAEMKKLYRYCLKLSHSPWTAEDLVQETLLKVIKLQSAEPDRTLTFSFLYTIAKNLFIDEKRKQLDVFSVEEDFYGEASSLIEYDSLIDILLSTLPLKQAMLLTLKDVFGFTSKEIAAMLRTSDESVKTALHRTRNKLKTVQLEEVHVTIPNNQLITSLSTAIKKANPQQIFLYYRQLEARHFQVRRTEGSAVCHIIDPDGNILELYCF